MSSEGWIKFHRGIFDSDIWTDVTTFRLFIYLIGKASHKDGLKYRGLTLNKGQYVRSYRKLADDLSYKEGRGYKKYSLHTIKRCIQKLIDAERVNVKETEVGTLFTVVNYAKYQGLEQTEKDTRNTLKEEPGTNPELSRNYPGTNPEQDQELKNLRIKELEEDDEEDTAHPLIESNVKKLINFFEQNGFGVVGGYVTDQMLSWLERVPADLILEAMKIGVEYGGKTWAYVNKILVNWSERGFRTIEQVRAAEKEHKEKMSKAKGFPRQRRAIRREKLPDWFIEHQNQGQKNSIKNDEDLEVRRKRLMAIQKKYKTGG